VTWGGSTMAAAEDPATADRDWKKGESFSSALVKIAVAGALLAGLVFFFVQRGERKKEIADRLKEARVLALRDNPKDLAGASKELEAIFALDPEAKDALALAADIETERWLFHRVEGSEQKAREYLRKAEALESRAEERFGSKILHLVAEGRARDAEKYAEDLRKQGASSAKLWYGIAQAHHFQGHAALSRQAYAQATDKAWKNPRYFAAFGEALLDQADYRQAAEIFNKGKNANPDHLRIRLGLSLAQIYREQQVKDAADAIQQVLALKDELTPGLKARALAAQAELANFEKRHDEAVRLATEAVAVNAQERFAHFARARALAFTRDPSALEAFRAATAQNRLAPAPYLVGAALLQQAGSFDGAHALLDDYERVYQKIEGVDAAGKTRPMLERDDKYWIVRGDAFRAEGKQDSAMEAYEKAIAADGVNRVRAYYAKAALLQEKKEYDKALEMLTFITPEDGSGSIAEAYQTKGEVLFAKKEFAQGCQNFALALGRMRILQVPRERLNALLEDVTRQLNANGQAQMAKVWEREANKFIR
jgi:tetratricopeptide (TPR) repeat protein